ncbi:unnamed protein product, partial [Amoebophrya sp. A25]
KRDRKGEAYCGWVSTQRKNRQGFSKVEIDCLLVHVRQDEGPEHVLAATYFLPVLQLQQEGYAPGRASKNSEEKWARSLCLYPSGVSYVKNPRSCWAAKYLQNWDQGAEECRRLKDSIFD